ncbi:hypothetical protein ACIQZG_04535 [Lysinibacillus sp. NPDC096418]|uniref:hypothetical protein n=1 Tax=Lysinibacillus sp. NPDC096418 TaxID=3364138 RepID=UPI0038215128
MTITLHTTENPINREQRVRINQNWDSIIRGLNNLQLTINTLPNENDFLDLTKRVQDAINKANIASENANEATIESYKATNDALKAIADVKDQIALSENTTLRANKAAESIEGWGTATKWNLTNKYIKNNVVTDNGSTWQALRTNVAVKPVEGLDWTCLAMRGVDGTGAVASVNGEFPNTDGNVNIDTGNTQALSQHITNETNQKHIEIFDVEPTDYVGVGLARIKTSSPTSAPVNPINYVDNLKENDTTGRAMHPQTNTGIVYDFNEDQWLDETLANTKQNIKDLSDTVSQHLTEYENKAIKKDADDVVVITNSPTSLESTLRGLELDTTLIANATHSTIAGMIISPEITRAISDTHQLVAGTYLRTPQILGSGSNITDAATLYIQGAPMASDIASAFGLFINGGFNRIRDTLGVGAVTRASNTLHVGTLAGTAHLALERLAGDGSRGKTVLGADVGGFYVMDENLTKKFTVDNIGNLTLYNGVRILSGSGAPEGGTVAPVGSLYLRSNGGANTTLYVKESGTGNTGWIAK